jgi:hypothetical protein
MRYAAWAMTGEMEDVAAAERNFAVSSAEYGFPVQRLLFFVNTCIVVQPASAPRSKALCIPPLTDMWDPRRGEDDMGEKILNVEEKRNTNKCGTPHDTSHAAFPLTQRRAEPALTVT